MKTKKIPEFFGEGDMFGDLVLYRVGFNSWCLIEFGSANRWGNPLSASSKKGITHNDIVALGGDPRDYTGVKIWDYISAMREKSK